MLLNKLLETAPGDRYASLTKRLRGLGRDISDVRTLTVPALYEMQQTLEDNLSSYKSKNLRFVVEDVAYQRDLMTLKAVQIMLEYKENRNRKEKLVNGQTYYRNVVIEGTTISGQRVSYLSERRVSDWTPFKDDVRVMKVMEVLSYGTDDDFRSLYVEKADGRLFESVADYVPEHISQSSNKALNEMASYCDKRWEGPWPWEARVPYKLFTLVKEARMTRLEELRKKLNESRRAITEGEVERSELVVKISGIRDVVASTIQRFGKLSGDFLTMGELVATELGDAAKGQIDELSNEQLRALVDQLTKFQQAVDGVLKTINGEGVEDTASPEFDSPSEEPADEFGDVETATGEPGEVDDFDMAGFDDEEQPAFGDEREMRA